MGVSANAAYRHFADKSALLTAVAASGFERLSKQMQRAMTRAADAASTAGAGVERFKAVGRAYVGFASKHPELFRLMFGPGGVGCMGTISVGASARARPTPKQLLAQTLDALVAAGVLTVARRAGAELQAWTVVHGFAALGLDGGAWLPTRRARTEALESVLQFTVVGLCGELPSTSAA